MQRHQHLYRQHLQAFLRTLVFLVLLSIPELLEASKNRVASLLSGRDAKAIAASIQGLDGVMWRSNKLYRDIPERSIRYPKGTPMMIDPAQKAALDRINLQKQGFQRFFRSPERTSRGAEIEEVLPVPIEPLWLEPSAGKASEKVRASMVEGARRIEKQQKSNRTKRQQLYREGVVTPEEDAFWMGGNTITKPSAEYTRAFNCFECTVESLQAAINNRAIARVTDLPQRVSVDYKPFRVTKDAIAASKLRDPRDFTQESVLKRRFRIPGAPKFEVLNEPKAFLTQGEGAKGALLLDSGDDLHVTPILVQKISDERALKDPIVAASRKLPDDPGKSLAVLIPDPQIDGPAALAGRRLEVLLVQAGRK